VLIDDSNTALVHELDQLTPDLSDPRPLLSALEQLHDDISREGQALFARWRPAIQRRAFLISGRNLACYLALRRRDLRPLQTALMPWGLSSLGRSEARVLPNLDAVIATLHAICRTNGAAPPSHPSLRAFFRGERLLQRNVVELFGPTQARRRMRIMVTLPTEAADNAAFVRDLVGRGMDCARINCAHDMPAVWERMIANVRQAALETDRTCRVLMDIAGPKPRTGEILTPPGARLSCGDRLLLTRGWPVETERTAFQTRCTLPEIVDQVQVGDSVWIDDGRLGTQVEARLAEGLLLRVTQARPKGEKLLSGKGLNFPDTMLHLSPLTDQDRRDLDFVAAHADIVGYSFVQDAADIDLLQGELSARLGERRPPAIVAKIETHRAIRNLPELIVHAAGRQPFGVMIARGDLAVEIGYQRLAEIQEEILWLCEAAHVPVIWATQVLENFVRKGVPSRAEMTDAAMAERAECVMLNKGPYVTEAVTILDDVLTRMQDHQVKKTPQLRALRAWAQILPR
jgi:pyruvate kinase